MSRVILPTEAHKHAVTALSSGETYTYDANGNMTQRIEGGLTYTQTFDAENRLISVTVNSQTTQFLYDGDGNLVKKTKPDGSKTIYAAGGVYEVDKTSGGSVTRTITYYPFAGAMRIDSTVYYVLKDHLGSASVVTDSTGVVVGEQRYYPFGETRLSTGTIFTDKLFTGQQEMSGLGIYNYGARFYSPKLGRFLSADTIVPGAANPQNLNRFSYVSNNPLRYTDPTGHCGVNGDADADDCHTPDGVTSNNSGGSPVIITGGNNGNNNGGDDIDQNPKGLPGPPITLELAIIYLQHSQLGQSLFDYAMAEGGYTFEYNTLGCAGHGGKNIVVPPPSCYKATATFIAGTLAHEITHNLLTDADDTLLEEYQAMLTGDIVRNDIIQAGYGTSSDMRHPLSVFTVDLNNQDKTQFAADLTEWFNKNNENIYTDPKPQGYNLPALPP